LNISPWLGIVMGALLAATVAAGLAAISLRTRGPFFTLMTIAFAEIVRILTVYFKSVTHGSVGILIDQASSLANLIFVGKLPYVLLALVYAFAIIGICFWTRNSKLGFYLLSVREDEDAARSLGVNSYATRILATAMSAAMAAVGGSLMAQYTLFIDPDSTLSF